MKQVNQDPEVQIEKSNIQILKSDPINPSLIPEMQKLAPKSWDPDPEMLVQILASKSGKQRPGVQIKPATRILKFASLNPKIQPPALQSNSWCPNPVHRILALEPEC